MAARASSRSLWTAKILGISSPKKSSPTKKTSSLKPKFPFAGSVLGIDPSLRKTGLSIVHFGPQNTLKLVYSKTIQLHATISFASCLGIISKTITDLLKSHTVKHVALEQTIFVQNYQIAQVLGAVRGAAIAASVLEGLNIFEYPPLRVKQAITGFGKASKEQVAKTILQILALPAALPLDESDAAAVALCHGFTYSESNE